MSKLLPCPFCGGRGILNLSAPLAYIYCEICDAQGTACDTNKGAVEHWNARAALDRIRQEAQEYTLSEKQSLDYKNIKKQVLAEVREAANSTRYAGRGLDELLNDLLDSTVEAELYHIIVYNLLKEWSLDNYYITEDYYSNSLPTDFSWYTVIDSTVIRFSEDGKRLAVATPV